MSSTATHRAEPQIRTVNAVQSCSPPLDRINFTRTAENRSTLNENRPSWRMTAFACFPITGFTFAGRAELRWVAVLFRAALLLQPVYRQQLPDVAAINHRERVQHVDARRAVHRFRLRQPAPWDGKARISSAGGKLVREALDLDEREAEALAYRSKAFAWRVCQCHWATYTAVIIPSASSASAGDRASCIASASAMSACTMSRPSTAPRRSEISGTALQSVLPLVRSNGSARKRNQKPRWSGGWLEHVLKIGSASHQVLMCEAGELLSFCHEEAAEAVDR